MANKRIRPVYAPGTTQPLKFLHQSRTDHAPCRFAIRRLRSDRKISERHVASAGSLKSVD